MNKTSTQRKSVKISEKRQRNQLICQSEDFEPSKNSIDKILNYSKALSIRKSVIIENVEMILN